MTDCPKCGGKKCVSLYRYCGPGQRVGLCAFDARNEHLHFDCSICRYSQQRQVEKPSKESARG